MSTLLGHVEGVHEIYAEIDHIICFAAQAWHHRAGYYGTRDKSVLEKSVTVHIGSDKFMASGPGCGGRTGTPPKSPIHGRRSPCETSTRSCGSRFQGVVRLGPPGSRPGPMALPAKNEVQAVQVPEYIIAESPELLAMYRASTCKQEIGPIPRCARLFHAVLGLCKLRWLIRLHSALISLGGHRCSLQRLLVGTLSDICNVHQHPHSPLEVYEGIVATLKTRMQQSWPLLLAYIGTRELATEHCQEHSTSDSMCSPRPFTAPHLGLSSTGFPLPYQPAYHPKNYQGKDAGHPDSAAFLWQVIDDLFIAWIVQQDPILYPAEQVWQELEFYGVPRPAVRNNLEGLAAWQQSKFRVGTHKRPAQRQAHHLAILLELPKLRDEMSDTDEEILETARDVVSHPRTFNAGVRARVAVVLQGRDELIGYCEQPCSVDMDEDQLWAYLSHCAAARDNGRLDNRFIETLRDKTAPWLHGREPRYKAAAKAWPNLAPRPGYLEDLDAIRPATAGSLLSPLSARARLSSTPIWR